jgi:ABC-type multidrug transport system fused ATPase/permease subunit
LPKMFSSSHHARGPKFWWSITLSVLVFLFASSTSAQSVPRNPSNPPPIDPPSSSKTDPPAGDFGSPESETRAKMLLKEEKKKYDEHVARAREVSTLANQICTSYETRKSFGAEDTKRLERMEKLTKRIRNDAGGEGSNEVDPENVPGTIEKAVKGVAAAAKDLQDLVEKTPRHVISAAVIDQANKLISMLQHLRDNTR